MDTVKIHVQSSLIAAIAGTVLFSTLAPAVRFQQNTASKCAQKGTITNPAVTPSAKNPKKGKMPPSTSVLSLNRVEITHLAFMREEEKMARDVYLFLHDQYGSRIFGNIAASEQRHADAIKGLLDRYGVEDPAAGLGQGVFKNPEIQALYDKLIDLGRGSRADAFKAGKQIEETDIKDLQSAAAKTTHPDINAVYKNLMRASYNHLAAFDSKFAK